MSSHFLQILQKEEVCTASLQDIQNYTAFLRIRTGNHFVPATMKCKKTYVTELITYIVTRLWFGRISLKRSFFWSDSDWLHSWRKVAQQLWCKLNHSRVFSRDDLVIGKRGLRRMGTQIPFPYNCREISGLSYRRDLRKIIRTQRLLVEVFLGVIWNMLRLFFWTLASTKCSMIMPDEVAS